MIFGATDDGSRATIQTDDPASRRCAPDSRSVSAPNIGLAHPALALLLLAVLAAPAQAAVLVSNIEQTVSALSPKLGTTQDLSQGFTTGTTAGTLDSIEVKFAADNDGSAHPTVTLHRGSPTSTAIATLTAPSGTIAATAANYTYTAPSNTTLTAATTYYVVLEGSDDDLAPQITTSDNEDSGGETGWSVANGYGFRTASSVGAFATSSSGAALLIRVNGTAATTCPVPDLVTGRTAVWTATMTVGESALLGIPANAYSKLGYFTHDGTAYGSLSDTSFTVNSRDYTINGVQLREPAADGNRKLSLQLNKLLADLDRADLQFHVCGTSYTLTGAAHQAQPPAYIWDPAVLDWTAGEIITLRLSATTVPSKPRNLAADGGDTQVTLTWTAPARDGATAITHYQYRHAAASTVPMGTAWTDVADGSDMGDSAADERSVAVSGLMAGTQYAFELRAVNSGGESTVAGPVTATLGLRSCSSAPDLAGMGRTAVWTATMTIGEYAVASTYSHLGSFTYEGTTYGSLSDTSFTVGSRSYTVDAVRLQEPLSDENRKLSIQFNKLLADLDRADLQFHVCGASYALTGAARQSQPPAYIWDPVELDWTAGRSVILRLSATTAPSKPRNLAADGGDTQVTLTWTAPARAGVTAITHYQYRHAVGTTVSTSTTWTDVTDGSDAGDSAADERSVTVSSLINGTEYAFEVRAVNSAGEGAKAGPVTATPAVACAMPDFGNRRNIWSGSLTAAAFNPIVYGFGGAVGSLDDKDFTIGQAHEIDAVGLLTHTYELRFSLKDGPLTSSEKAALRLHVCDAAYDFSAAGGPTESHTYSWLNTGLDWPLLSTQTLHLSLPANNAATGVPTISGTTTVGSMLTADTGTIADADGLPTTLTYQWIRVDGSNETDISGATSSTYTLVAADDGKEFKVKVSFTDDLGSEEELISHRFPPPSVSIAAVYPTAVIRVANPEFRVTISAAQTSAVTVNISIDQDAGYLSSTTQTIEIAANETSATGKFSGFYGGTTSGDLTATVVAGTGYVPAATPANAATVDVLAPGIANVLSYKFDATAYSVDEGDSAEVVVTLHTAANVPKPRESFSASAIMTSPLTGEGDMATQSAGGDPGDYTVTNTSGGFFAPGDWSADGAVFTATRTYTVPTTEDSAYEGDERFKIEFFSSGGSIGSKGSPDETIVTIVDDDALKVTGVAVSSMPSSGSTYGAGETISFKATFSAKVTVTGTPQLSFSLGGTTKRAAFASGSDSTELVFSYTVSAGDNDTDGVSWSANALSLNGGTIKFMTSVVANRVDAALTHAAGDAQSGHKVDTPPRLEERTVDGAALTLTYNETLDANSRPAASAFAVTVGGATAPLASGNSVTVSGTTVTLTLATALTAQDTNVRVSYVKPTSNPIRDAGGTDAAAFSNQVVSNRTTDGPTLSAAEVDGTGLVLTFSDPLNTASAPASAAFTVKVGGSAVSQASSGPVAITGSAVTLTLATAVAASDTVTVSYAVPQTNPLRGTDDLDAAAFDDRPVTNRTIAVPDAPDSFRVTAGDKQAELSWAAPSFDGNSPITKYRYRYAAGTTVPTTRAWTDVPDSNNDNSLADERAVTVTGLTNETEYAFEIQAVNSAGGGPEASASATPVEDPNLPSVVLELRAQTGDATVTLEWGPPLRTGSHHAIDYYEYRYAEGSSVPTSTSWASADAGRHPFTQITGLENGRSYAFEVRAVNKHGYKGPVATLTARPHARVVQTLPTAPRGLRGDGSLYVEGGEYHSSVTERAQVKLGWEAPSNLGNSHLIRYEYRYAARGESLSSSAWNHGPASERTLTVRNLVAGTSYTFQLRAVTLAGAGRAASVGVTTPRSERLSLSVFTRGSAVEGENLTIGVRRSGTPNKAVLVVVDIHDSTTGRWSAKSVDIAAGAREGTVEFAVPFDGERGAARELEVTLGPGSWKPESAYRVGSPASATVRVRNRDALLRVRDATVREGPQAVLRFDVSLDRAAPGRVTVDYATSDVTATAGADYTAASDTLSFAAGEISKTVSVAVLDDAHDEGTETLTLTLSNASGAAIDDGTATGRIINTDAMPQAWLARFGRTASDHVIQAIESRLHGDGSARAESHLTIGGRRVDTFFDRGRRDAPMNGRPDTPDPRPEPEPAGARADRPEAEALGPADVGGADGDPADGGLSGSGSAGRRLASLLGLPDLDRGLMGSSFLYSSRADGGHAPGWLGQWSAWGQTAETRFDGADGRLSLHGEVATATVGFETRRERWLAGVAVSHSEGEGAYAQANAGGGTVTSELTNVAPFARYDLSDRVSLWGALGYGAGGLSLTPKRADAAIETGLTNAMAAFGARTALTALSWRAGRFELSALSDARVTSTRSETAHNLMGAAGLTSRVRVLLAGAGSMPLANGGALRPTLEAGLRHDGGDAETGAGVELGVGLGYAAGRFSLQVDARGLLAHQDTEYGEWGFSGSASYAAGDAGRGLRLDLGSARGATQSGVDSLWNSQDASGLARGVAMDAGQRLNAELAYGLPGPRGRALWTPYVGANADGGQRALRLGVKLSSGPNVEAGLEIGRRLAPLKAPEHAIRLGVSMRW